MLPRYPSRASLLGLALLAFLAAALLFVFGLAPARADLIKQGAAYTRTVLMTSASDHITGATGLTLTVVASKAGGAPAAITPTVTEIGNGRYALALTTTHTNTLGALDLTVTATGADPSDTHDQVLVDVPGGAAASVTGNVGGNVNGNLGGYVTGGVGGDVQGNLFGSVGGHVVGYVGSVQGSVGTVTDKTGYSLASSQAFSNSTASTVVPTWYTAPPALPSDFLSAGEQASLSAAAGNTPAATVTALMNKSIPSLGAGMTVGKLLVLLGVVDVKIGPITNTFTPNTHLLDTAYVTPGDSLTAITTHAQYPTTQTTNPALLSVTATVGTVTQP